MRWRRNPGYEAPASRRRAASAGGGARVAATRFAVAAALLLHAALAGADEMASVSVATESARFAGEPAKVDVYLPEGRDAVGVAVLAHGFSRNRTYERDLGRALAQAGVVAVAPDLPHVADGPGNAGAIEELVRALERGALGLPPTPRARLVLIGTSAGGIATLIAASELPGLAGWVGLDPVEQGASGASAAEKLAVPALVLLGDHSICNLFGTGRSIAQALPETLGRSKRMHGASHCDFEGPTNKFCRTVCGRSAPGMAEEVRREAVDAALEMLNREGSGRAAVPERGEPR